MQVGPVAAASQMGSESGQVHSFLLKRCYCSLLTFSSVMVVVVISVFRSMQLSCGTVQFSICAVTIDKNVCKELCRFYYKQTQSGS
jgi:hypothetical protein